ncbi:hypothetical protein B0A48_13039 [Cryoendolithus antarcticus]|uniref:Sialidase n=1 Tax=Cryoendolithus antarcticus TaxID=1507870 RepID=A0A1V8SR35_9PEZI|nr:hypothetical protein B0A48_13039 [Cryoendolithus antarcticus]
MEYRGLTPPPSAIEGDNLELLCPGGSASTNATYNTQDWSPESLLTAASTPPKSPYKARESGAVLLPRVRAQDQLMGSSAMSKVHGHLRTTSLPNNGFPMQFGGHLPSRPDLDRRSTSPPVQYGMVSPAASACAPSMVVPWDVIPSTRPPMSQMRSVSASRVPTHSRNSSSGSVDASMLSRYGYPTYRQSPTPQPMGLTVPMSRTPSAMNHLAPISMPGGQVPTYPQRRRTASPPALPSRLAIEIAPEPESPLDIETSTLSDYLSRPNPTPALTQRTVETRGSSSTTFWFDVRNVNRWEDFNATTVSEIPGFTQLLNIDVSSSHLPTPARVSLNPETQAHLAETCAAHHALKVNAALKVSQGEKHIAMRALKSPPHAPRQQPDFVSNYQSDAQKTIYGDGRGRVVGIIRCFDQWNTGMRNESPLARISYLRALSQLHHYMRDHGCRYGFIMTEIELVCVRAGGPPDPNNPVPLFGFLELSAPVQIATHGLSINGELQMTVDLALWYLHMLAKETPLPGQYSWRMDVGGPAALSRKHHLAADSWVPKVHQSERREAKRARGWTFPDEPLSKRECGKTGRAKR